MHPAAFGETIAVVDRSGKVISTSKHLINVFKDARIAYRERKAEIVAGRQVELEQEQARRALRAFTLDDDRHSRSSSKDSRRTKSKSRSKPLTQRQHSSSYYTESIEPRSRRRPTSSLRYSQDPEDIFTRPDLPRRHTTVEDHEQEQQLTRLPLPTRSLSTPGPHIDMDLAYGDIPPPLPVARVVVGNETELKTLLSKVNVLLDEANCLQYSVTAIISNLQKNPDALAAVALTLAEISNVAAKMAPGILTTMKGSFPAVIALLASPQFMIAAGVGVGVTIVALGGYKIIKKIKARNAAEAESMDELQEYDGDVSRIETWRRGIAAEPSSPIEMEGFRGEGEIPVVMESVDGEFITPEAAAMRKAIRKEKKKKNGSGTGEKREKEKKEKKKPSRLQMLFK
ncbi:MAG: hypothetical protein M1827_007744 [Pycnora praestabilis]|nr:MAG: hypothetical protein M1827_007744 [Pycnora praestabilis]